MGVATRQRPRTIKPRSPNMGVGISVRRLTNNDRGILRDPESRLGVMRSIFLNEKLTPARRVQLAERMILGALQIPKFTNKGIIEAIVLRTQTMGISQPEIYRVALLNLIRKRKIEPVGSGRYRSLIRRG